MTAGYSGTPLVKKLGIKENFKIRAIGAPSNYFELLGGLPEGVTALKKKSSETDFIHLFVKALSELKAQLPHIKNEIKKNGTIWISWYKKSAGIATDVTEDKIRDIALKEGLVDVKVCAVDEIWSGLKLVYRLKDR
jgi:hypothetical protein